MSVFNHCYTTEPRCIHLRGFVKYDHKIIKELLEEIDPYIESANISFRDTDVVEREIKFIKFSKDDRWHYRDALILFGDREYLFEKKDNE